jgi:outer membrane murein-binding lipoprotein Lpp
MILRTILLVLALSGCAALPPAIDPVDAVVREAAQAARANAAEQKAALAAAQKAFVAESSTYHRLRLAALLVTLPAPLRDDARAGELLEPMVEATGSSTGRFAAFLATQIAERQNIAREVQKLSAEIDRLTKERAQLERERQAADKERDKREEALRQQLEALRAIERGILDREERLRRNPGAKP